MDQRINIGLTMKRGHESRHNACRRLYVANPGINASEITKRLRVVYADYWGERVRHAKPFTVARTLSILEASYCQAYGIPYQEAPADPTVRLLKNCPVCATQIYHSNLYDVSWLTHCPLHNEPLLTNCPSCQQPWPMDGHVARRQCGTCGIPSSLKSSIHSGAFVPHDNGNTLDLLHQCIDQETKNQQCCVIYHSDDDNSTNHFHMPTPISDRFYSTVLAAQSDSNQVLLDRLGVAVESYTHWKMDRWSSKISVLTAHEHLNTDSAQRARHNVHKVITKSAILYQGSYEPVALMAGIPNNLDLDAVNLFSLALTLWDQLIHARPIARRIRTHWAGNPLYDPSLQVSTPAPMIWYDYCPDARFNPKVIPNLHYRAKKYLPDAARDVIYRLDLWALYINLCAYLSRLRKGQMQGMSQGRFLASLPKLTLPYNAYCYPLEVFVSQDDQLNIIVPACLSHFDLERSLQLFLNG